MRFFKKEKKEEIKDTKSSLRFWFSLVFILAGVYSILQLLGIRIPVEVDGNILLWITSIGCLLAGLLMMFRKK